MTLSAIRLKIFNFDFICQNASNLFIFRQAACAVHNPFLLFAAHFYLMKKSAKMLATRCRDTKPPSKHTVKCIVLALFGDRFVKKDGGLRIRNPSAEEVEDWK
jgi:hypothetical protein